MGTQQFSAKRIRRYSLRFDLDIDMLWSCGNHRIFEGRTSEDRHFWLNLITGEVEWVDPERADHKASCGEKFGYSVVHRANRPRSTGPSILTDEGRAKP